jgi:hypothetical protein
MPERDRSHQFQTHLIDIVALVAALTWFGAAVLLSWWRSDAPLLTSLVRALMGAIIVYVITFIVFYVMVWMARRAGSGRKKITPEQE